MKIKLKNSVDEFEEDECFYSYIRQKGCQKWTQVGPIPAYFAISTSSSELYAGTRIKSFDVDWSKYAAF